MAEPRISVVMPAYNAAEFIGEALDSITGQTFQDWECVTVDDGSEDGAGDIAQQRAKSDSRIRVVRRGREGLVSALNAGLEAARAPLVARMDADDMSLPGRLERQYSLMESQPGVTVCGCLVRSFPESAVGEGMLLYEEWLNSLTGEEEIRRDFFVESPFAHPSVMFRRNEVLEAGGYRDNGWPEDYDLWMRLYLRGARFAKVPEVLLLWRDGPRRLSRTDRVYTQARFRKLKAHYLVQSYLKERREVTIWGAGREGRWWCRELTVRGIEVKRFIDIDPKKIGCSIGDAPVLAPESLENREEGDFMLCAVGARGARPLIRARLLDYGRVELRDYLFLT